MAGALRKTMLYLGLAEPDVYDDEQDEAQDEGQEPDVTEPFGGQVTPFRRSEQFAAPVAAAELRRITTVHPRSYNDARAIGEAFRSGVPVIINLTDMDDGDAKRLVDFSAGLIFGLRGAIERVTNKVFLLTPATVEVSSEGGAPEGSARSGFYNQN
ncbi:MAG: cell division protein SepF [Micrococcales bacterium]|nr:cell division protein SepF [Micrococcales bacterium]